MSLSDQIDDILIQNGLKQPPPPPPEPEERRINVPDPYDEIRCPKCECNAWQVIAESEHIAKPRQGNKRVPVLVRKLRLQCENRFCGRIWKHRIREHI